MRSFFAAAALCTVFALTGCQSTSGHGHDHGAEAACCGSCGTDAAKKAACCGKCGGEGAKAKAACCGKCGGK